MKRIKITLVTVFSICCLVACGGEKTKDTNVGGNSGEPVVTEAPADEAEVTPAPAEVTAEPTAAPVETLTALRNEALAEHSRIISEVEYRFDVALEILEVAKDYPNFNAEYYCEILPMIKSDFEENLLTWNIDDTVGSNTSLIMLISDIIVECPELKTTEEFQKFVEAPIFDSAIYNGKVDAFNYALSNSTSTEFEELPYCFTEDTKSSINY